MHQYTTLAAALIGLATVSPCHRLCAQSAYIDKVYDFRPAPGQFVGVLPAYEDGDSEEDMRRKTEECLAADAQVMVSLGAYGGYVVFGFDHMVVNTPGHYDLQVLGNAFRTASSDNAGSAEPGIIMVSYDANANGLPDDTWYELAGSEDSSTETLHNYTITYQRPDPLTTEQPDDTYIRWTDSQGAEGYIPRNSFHTQSYWPLWLGEETLTFTGTRLADNYVDQSGNGTYYIQYAYPWGYADNHPNNDERAKLNLEWAVDEQGCRVNIPGAHFVKVYTAVNQVCGWIGESSTEILGAADLHILGQDTEDTTDIHATAAAAAKGSTTNQTYDMAGRRVATAGRLHSGLYIVDGRKTLISR